jgi:hypothetical protein
MRGGCSVKNQQPVQHLELSLPKLRRALAPTFGELGFTLFKSYFVRESPDIRQILTVRKENPLPEFYALQWNLLVEFRNDDTRGLSMNFGRNREDEQLFTVVVARDSFDDVVGRIRKYVLGTLSEAIERTSTLELLDSLPHQSFKTETYAFSIQRFDPRKVNPPPLPWFT